LDRSQYFYGDAGFSKFLVRSIGNPGQPARTLTEYARTATQQTRNVNFDQQQITGNMSGAIDIGGIRIDGTAPNITMSKDDVVRAIFGAAPDG